MQKGRFVVAAWLTMLGTGAIARGEDTEVFTAVRQDILFARVGFCISEKEPRIAGPGATGMAYHMAASAEGLRIHSLQIAVHASRAAAETAVRAVVQSMSIGPDHYQRDPYTDIGDARYVWTGGGEGGGTIVFLRQNITVAFPWAGKNDGALALARRIDEVIRSDRDVAPRGKLAATPEIVSTGVPERVRKGARIQITPEFRGLGDRANLRIAVLAPDSYSSLTETTLDGRSSPEISYRGPRPGPPGGGETDLVRPRQPDEDGRFILRIPDKSGPVKLTMIVATPDNVIVTKEFTVNVTD